VSGQVNIILGAPKRNEPEDYSRIELRKIGFVKIAQLA